MMQFFFRRVQVTVKTWGGLLSMSYTQLYVTAFCHPSGLQKMPQFFRLLTYQTSTKCLSVVDYYTSFICKHCTWNGHCYIKKETFFRNWYISFLLISFPVTLYMKGGRPTLRSGRFAPGKDRYLSRRRPGSPQGRSGRVRKSWPPPGFDPQTAQHLASHYAGPLFSGGTSFKWAG